MEASSEKFERVWAYQLSLSFILFKRILSLFWLLLLELCFLTFRPSCFLVAFFLALLSFSDIVLCYLPSFFFILELSCKRRKCLAGKVGKVYSCQRKREGARHSKFPKCHYHIYLSLTAVYSRTHEHYRYIRVCEFSSSIFL